MTHVPEVLTPDIRRQVVEDIKTIKALELAAKRAEEIAAEARKNGLDAAAKKAGLDSTTTGLFARRRPAWGPPMQFALTDVPGLEAPAEAPRAFLMERAFSLVPQQVEPPYDKGPPAVAAASVPARKEAVVLERVGYRPAVAGEFENPGEGQLGRTRIAVALMTIRRWRAARTYFAYENVARRVGFTPRTRE